AAGGSGIGRHGVFLAWQADRVWPHGAHFHRAEGKTDRGLRHRKVRLMEPVERHVRHFQEELDQLKTRLLEMGGLAEEKVRLAVKGLVDRDPELIDRVIAGDE